MLEGEGVYHLSTSMYPNHRKSILKKIRERLSRKTEMCSNSYKLGGGRCGFGFQTCISSNCRN